MRIAIIGTGYVGLVTACCFAEMGNVVVCHDTDVQKIINLNNLVVPIFEPGLDLMLRSNFAMQRIRFTTDLADALNGAELCFICVGTPSDEDGSADLKHVLESAGQIGKRMKNDLLVVVKSTVPVGTNDLVRNEISKELELRKTSYSFDVASNPEFLKEGDAINDCMRPDRIIIGADDIHTISKMRSLYLPFVKDDENIIMMDIRSAEMTKYVSNAMLATKISFMNEMANVCERVGADINKVRIGIGSDKRIGYSFIYPGCGFGGSCFPKDIHALIALGNSVDYQTEILKAVTRVNEHQKRLLAQKIKKNFGEDLNGKRFCIWGLAFKPETDDIREASAITILNELTSAGAYAIVYDPVVRQENLLAQMKFPDRIEFASDKYEGLADADALVLVTEWKEFTMPDFDIIKKKLRSPIIFDGRNQYNHEHLSDLGIKYIQIGVGE